MERTKFPATIKSEVKKYTFDEITEGLSNSEKNRVLENQTEIQAECINLKKSVYNIGKRLHENKQILPHGMFIPWIELAYDNELPYSTANFYMKVYEAFENYPSTIQYIPTKYLQMITTKEFPAEVVKLINDNPTNVNKKGLQNINEVYRLFKSGTIGGSQFLKLSEKQIKLGIDIMKGSTTHRLNTNMRHSLEFGAGDILERIDSIRQMAQQMAGVYPHDPDSPEHKKLIKVIDDTVNGLQKLKIDLEGGDGLFKSVSTKNGNKYISNL